MPHQGRGNEAPLITISLDQSPEGDDRAGFDPPASSAEVVELLTPCSGLRAGARGKLFLSQGLSGGSTTGGMLSLVQEGLSPLTPAPLLLPRAPGL